MALFRARLLFLHGRAFSTCLNNLSGARWKGDRGAIAPANYELRVTNYELRNTVAVTCGSRWVWHRTVVAPGQVEVGLRTGPNAQLTERWNPVVPCAIAIHFAGWLATVERFFGPVPSSCTWQKAEPRPQCSKYGRTEKEIESHSGNSLGTSLRACCRCVLRIIAARNAASHTPDKGARSKVEHDEPKQSEQDPFHHVDPCNKRLPDASPVPVNHSTWLRHTYRPAQATCNLRVSIAVAGRHFCSPVCSSALMFPRSRFG